MKKLIAILLVLVMAASAIVTIAAETGTAVTPEIEAPTVLGYQVGDHYDENGETVEGFVNVRFVSYVTSLDADVLGYDIKAYYTKVDGEGNTTGGTPQVFTATDDPETTTEYNKVFKYILENKEVDGEPVQVKSSVADVLEDESVEGYFFLYSVKKIPASANLFFEITTYAKVGEEKVDKSETTTLYCDANGANKNGEIVSTTYNFSEAAVTPADFGANGKFSNANPFSIENGKLVVPTGLVWNDTDEVYTAVTTLLSSKKLGEALKNGDSSYHQTYVVGMDLELVYGTTLPVFTLLLNTDSSATTASEAVANGVGARLLQQKGGSFAITKENGYVGVNGTNYGGKDSAYNGDHNNKWTWGKYNIPNTHDGIAPIKFNFTLAYTYISETEGARLDVFIDGSHCISRDVPVSDTSSGQPGTVPGLKFDKSGNMISDVTLIAQNFGHNVKIDNLTVSVPADTNAGVINTSTKKLNTLKKTYVATYDGLDKYGIEPVGNNFIATYKNTGANAYATDGGALKIDGGYWNNHLLTLLSADLVNADNGKLIVDMKLTVNKSTNLSLILNNNIDLNNVNTYTDLNKNGTVTTRLKYSDNTVWFVGYNSGGTGSNSATKTLPSGKLDLRIIVDGAVYSLYLNGEHIVTKDYSDRGATVNSNTSLVLHAESVDLTISDLTISTFQ